MRSLRSVSYSISLFKPYSIICSSHVIEIPFKVLLLHHLYPLLHQVADCVEVVNGKFHPVLFPPLTDEPTALKVAPPVAVEYEILT